MSIYTTLTEKIYDYLHPICQSAGVDDLIFDYDDGVRLKDDFVAINIRSIANDYKPEVVYELIGGTVENEEIVKYRGMVTMYIDIYSNSQAFLIADLIKTNIAREWAHENAMRLNLGLVNFGDTINLSAIEKTKFQHRAQFELLLNYAIVHKIVDTTIGTSRIRGDNTDGVEIVDVTITDGL